MSAQRMLDELNRVRTLGCTCGSAHQPAQGPLWRDERLDAAAQRHSEDMAWRDLLDHTSASGASPFDRMRAAGYDFRAAGENIASGNADSLATLQQWVNSPGHCLNMMSPLFTQVGIGHASSRSGQHYWTLDLAAPA